MFSSSISLTLKCMQHFLIILKIEVLLIVEINGMHQRINVFLHMTITLFEYPTSQLQELYIEIAEIFSLSGICEYR